MSTSESAPSAAAATPPRSRSRTLAFGVCFYAWALLGPLGPDLQKQLGLSDFELLVTVAVPVLLGSLMRIPLGILTDRHGGRKVFTALMAFTPLPLIGLALFNDSWTAVLVFGFLLGFAGASFAVGVPFVNKWYPAERQGFALGIYGIGMGGTVLGALTAPKIADATSLDVPFWIAAGLVGAMALVFWSLAEDAPGSASGAQGSWLAPLAVFRGPGAEPRVGADALLLHGLRRLRRDVPVPAEAADRRSRPVASPTPATAPPGSRRLQWSAARSAAGCRIASARRRVLQVSFGGTLVLALGARRLLQADGAADDSPA